MADTSLLYWMTIEGGRDTPVSKVQSLSIWAGYQERVYDSILLNEVVDGVYEPKLIYLLEYFRTMLARLCLFDAKKVIPNNSTW